MLCVPLQLPIYPAGGAAGLCLNAYAAGNEKVDAFARRQSRFSLVQKVEGDQARLDIVLKPCFMPHAIASATKMLD